MSAINQEYSCMFFFVNNIDTISNKQFRRRDIVSCSVLHKIVSLLSDNDFLLYENGHASILPQSSIRIAITYFI